MRSYGIRYYAIGSLTIWLVNQLFSAVRRSQVLVPNSLSVSEDIGITTIAITPPSWCNLEPGQYFFVNIPHISLSEWHPFTVSASLKGDIVFNIKDQSTAGNTGSWTHALRQLAREVQLQQSPMPCVRLDGPFGYAPFMEYENLVLIAGGIGITPFVNVVAHVHRAISCGASVRPRNIQLVWVVQSSTMPALYSDLFAAINALQEAQFPRGGVFDIEIYVTRGDIGSDIPGIKTVKGRCNLDNVITTIQNPRSTLIGVCGPESLVQEVSHKAYIRGCDFHSEEFAF